MNIELEDPFSRAPLYSRLEALEERARIDRSLTEIGLLKSRITALEEQGNKVPRVFYTDGDAGANAVQIEMLQTAVRALGKADRENRGRIVSIQQQLNGQATADDPLNQRNGLRNRLEILEESTTDFMEADMRLDVELYKRLDNLELAVQQIANGGNFGGNSDPRAAGSSCGSTTCESSSIDGRATELTIRGLYDLMREGFEVTATTLAAMTHKAEVDCEFTDIEVEKLEQRVEALERDTASLRMESATAQEFTSLQRQLAQAGKDVRALQTAVKTLEARAAVQNYYRSIPVPAGTFDAAAVQTRMNSAMCRAVDLNLTLCDCPQCIARRRLAHNEGRN